METNCYICRSWFLKTSHYHSKKTLCNFMNNLTKFLNSTNSYSFGEEDKESIDFNKSSENMFCCDQCSGDIEIFCQLWESRESLWSDIIRVVVTILNLIKSKRTKFWPETVNCFICQSVRKEIKIAEEYSRVVGRCKHFKLCLTRFLSNTKKPLLDKGILKEIAKNDDYCCEKCLPEMETFCEIYEAIDSVQLELFRLLDKIFHHAKTKSGGKDTQSIPILWQNFALKVERRRKRHYPLVKLEQLQFPNQLEVSREVKVEADANVNSDMYVETMEMETFKLEPAPAVNIRMEFEPGFVTMSNFKTEAEPIPDDEVAKQAKEKKYQCLFCPSNFVSRYHLERHIKTHIAEATYNCRICLKEFRDDGAFLNHCRKVHRPMSGDAQLLRVRKGSFQCHLCERRCVCRRDLLEHIQAIHCDERSVSCEICGARFKSNNSLRGHLLGVHHHKTLHPDDAKYKCSFNGCQATFFWSSSMKKHMPTHSEERPFQCHHCQKSFKMKTALSAHIRNCHKSVCSGKTLKCEQPGCD